MNIESGFHMYHLTRRTLTVAVVVFAIAALVGCGGGSSVTTAPPPAGVPNGGTVVTDHPVTIMPFSEAQALPRGTTLAVYLNRSATAVTSYPCSLISAVVDTGERLVECQMPPTVTIGNGDSGAPVMLEKIVGGKVVSSQILGALAYGFSANAKDFSAKSIEDMQEVNGYVGTAAVGSRRPIGLAFQTNASERAVRFINSLGHGNDQFVVTASIPNVSTSGGVPESAPTIAGQSISANYVTGDLVNGGAVGTLTYKQANGTWLVFGHPLDFYGQRTVPVSLASMDAMIDTTLGSFKQAHPTKETMGALVQDRQQGCLVDPAVTPTTSPIIVMATVGGKQTAWRHNLLRDGGSGAETYFCGLSIFTSLDRALGQIAKLASVGTVTIKFEGSEPATFDIATPATYTTTTGGGGTVVYPPYDAANEVTSAVMGHVYKLASANWGKSLEFITVDIAFSDWTPPAQ